MPNTEMWFTYMFNELMGTFYFMHNYMYCMSTHHMCIMHTVHTHTCFQNPELEKTPPTPSSLYELAAHLLHEGLVQLQDLYPHVKTIIICLSVCPLHVPAILMLLYCFDLTCSCVGA